MSNKDYLLQIHDRYMDCPTCDGYMIPDTDTYTKQYKGQDLKIYNLPILKCQCVGCQEVVYGSGSLIKYIRFAKSQYDQLGTVSFDVNKIKEL
jgi:YgiT-type zinc finger domain-containing protein